MDTEMKVATRREHQWLRRLVGEWTFEGEARMGPGQPSVKYTGTESARSLMGAWTVIEGRGDQPGGGTSSSLMTLGYDVVRERFVGTFVTGMMTHLWIYEGDLDEAANRLTLDTEGPSFTTQGQMVKYEDFIELLDDDHRVMTSRFLGDDGEWHEFMPVDYRRMK